MFFSLCRQRGRTKRELVARSGSDKITIPSIFAAGLATLKQVLAMPKGTMLDHRILYLPLSLSQRFKVEGAA